jgi:phosphatidate cytidylyltransferase
LKVAAVIAATAPLSDLSASMLKRNLDVKDFGTLLPGHGGALDRFCSFLLVLPSVYYLTLVVKPG